MRARGGMSVDVVDRASVEGSVDPGILVLSSTDVAVPVDFLLAAKALRI